jgi:tetratricopeptide (TPR) repeat protein
MQKALKQRESLQQFIKQPQRMLLVPDLADVVGLLHADSTVLAEMGLPLPQVTRRLLLRVPLIDYVAKLWRRYPHDLNAELPGLLPTLCGRSFGMLRARARFEAWWPEARASLLRHDRAVAGGLTALSGGHASLAEKCFRAALSEHPRELSARYNLAICATRRRDHDEAARLLRELTVLEPKEPYWWMVLGDIHRTVNKTSEAYAAFKRALDLGAAEGRVAWHLGLTFGRDRRDQEAIQQLDRVLGKDPTPARIDKLVSELESEGLWNLAGHYRDEAFRRGLSQNLEEDGRDNDAVG